MKKQKMTLFARYKQMINTLWADGQRKYTAHALNHLVGQYENSTSWKRYNNNPYYTTRLYQSALKQLGCITKIKRGVWQINGPIPEWFGSFHIGALTNKYTLQSLEGHSTYWNMLRPEHKVNPWLADCKHNTPSIKQGEPNTIQVDAQMMNVSVNYDTTIPGLTVKAIWTIYGDTEGEFMDYTYYINHKEVSVMVVGGLCEAYNKDINDILVEVEQTTKPLALSQWVDITKPKQTTKGETYTKEQVKAILETYTDRIIDAIRNELPRTTQEIPGEMISSLQMDRDNYISVRLDYNQLGDIIIHSVRDIIYDLQDGYSIPNAKNILNP